MVPSIIPTESEEQIALFDWRDWSIGKFPELGMMFAIHNGLPVQKSVAKKAVRLGTVKGVPDVFLPVPRKGFHGLWIELKRQKGGVVSDEQSKYHEQLRLHGYQVDVCHGSGEAVKVITSYLNPAAK